MFAGNTKEKLQKAIRWYAQRTNTLHMKIYGKRTINMTISSTRRNKRFHFKSFRERGRKRAMWVSALYEELLKEFDILRSTGVKFILLQHSRHLIASSDTKYPLHYSLFQNGKPIVESLSSRWVQNFMCVSGIVLRSQTGKLMVSPLNKSHI